MLSMENYLSPNTVSFENIVNSEKLLAGNSSMLQQKNYLSMKSVIAIKNLFAVFRKINEEGIRYRNSTDRKKTIKCCLKFSCINCL